MEFYWNADGTSLVFHSYLIMWLIHETTATPFLIVDSEANTTQPGFRRAIPS